MITVWNPQPITLEATTFVEQVRAMSSRTAEPFSDELVDCIGRISAQLLRDPLTRALPQYVALGYWMRAAAIRRLAEEARAAVPSREVVAPRGLALHLPPMNVDTIFVYSWVLSVLAGNANIVRLPGTMSAAAATAVRIIAEELDRSGQSERHLFSSYPYGGEVEAALSASCDLRIIWGGDAKVEAVSKVPIRPDGLSIGFPDRQSIALLAVPAYAAADPALRDELANKLYNDAYWFDQMGCSSPRLLAWIGEGDVDGLAKDLFTRLDSVIQSKSFAIAPSVAVSKLLLTNDLLAEGLANRGVRYSNELQVVDVSDGGTTLDRHGGGGFFSQSRYFRLGDVATIASRKLQTITHFGFAADELTALARSLAGRGGYRIVPLGQALDFEAVWDGVPLLSHMTRRIVVRTS